MDRHSELELGLIELSIADRLETLVTLGVQIMNQNASGSLGDRLHVNLVVFKPCGEIRVLSNEATMDPNMIAIKNKRRYGTQIRS